MEELFTRAVQSIATAFILLTFLNVLGLAAIMTWIREIQIRQPNSRGVTFFMRIGLWGFVFIAIGVLIGVVQAFNNII